eukprot:6742110-Pyramimonas_sp.AAC.3
MRPQTEERRVAEAAQNVQMCGGAMSTAAAMELEYNKRASESKSMWCSAFLEWEKWDLSRQQCSLQLQLLEAMGVLAGQQHQVKTTIIKHG